MANAAVNGCKTWQGHLHNCPVKTPNKQAFLKKTTQATKGKLSQCASAVIIISTTDATEYCAVFYIARS